MKIKKWEIEIEHVLAIKPKDMEFVRYANWARENMGKHLIEVDVIRDVRDEIIKKNYGFKYQHYTPQ